MTILFDLTAIYDHLTGIERYAINISKNIINNHPEDSYILLFKEEIHKDFMNMTRMNNVDVAVIPKCHKLVFQQWRLMRELYRHKADCYVFLSFVCPWFFNNRNIFTTIHDISAWDCEGTRKRHMILYAKMGIRHAIKVSKKIITVSEFSKGRLIDRLKVDEERVSVVYNGLSNHFTLVNRNQLNDIYKKYDIPNDYLLCLSTLEPRKNMKLLIKAFCELIEERDIKYDLVLAGRRGWKFDEAVGDIVGPYKDRIHITGFVDDEDLPDLYSNARAFVFPSIYEGFGIPIIEAMSRGTVVISSNSSSLPEVIGDAGLLFENNSVEALKKTICDYDNMSEDEVEDLKRKGFDRAKSFSWQREAEKLVYVLNQK